MPELTVLIYILITVVTIWLGIHEYGRWINHITIYGVVWGTQIILFEMKFIAYPNLSSETIIFIFGTWIVFVVSSLTFRRFYSDQKSAVQELPIGGNNVLLVILLGFTLIGAAGTYQHWMVLIRLFGSIKSVILSGNIIYSAERSETGIPGMWPYVDSIGLSADFLGGYFAGFRRCPIFLGIIPVVVELANAVSGFGRSRFIIGVVLWTSAFFLPQMRRRVTDKNALIKRLALFSTIVLIFIFGMETVRAFRATNEFFTGETSSLSRIKGIGFITPSVYMYLSSDVAVLNKFLDYQFSGKVEHTPIGGYTFGPFFRFFSKFGLVASYAGLRKILFCSRYHEYGIVLA